MGPPGLRGPQVSTVQGKTVNGVFLTCRGAASFTLQPVKCRRLKLICASQQGHPGLVGAPGPKGHPVSLLCSFSSLFSSFVF